MGVAHHKHVDVDRYKVFVTIKVMIVSKLFFFVAKL